MDGEEGERELHCLAVAVVQPEDAHLRERVLARR
jgi:hypothetical protein